jgi:cell division protease FtsH
MVTEYGMSTSLGPVSYADSSADVFLGRDFMTRKDYSDKKAEQIDDEVTSILTEKYSEAQHMLSQNRGLLDRIAAALLERETLETADLALLLKGESLPPLPIVTESVPREEIVARPARPERTKKEFPGDKIPDPEPFPS